MSSNLRPSVRERGSQDGSAAPLWQPFRRGVPPQSLRSRPLLGTNPSGWGLAMSLLREPPRRSSAAGRRTGRGGKTAVPAGLGIMIVLMGLASPVLAEEVRGRIVWQGPLPAPERIAVKPKASQGPDSIKGCGHEKDSPELRVDPSGGVENVVIWVEGVHGAPPSQAPVLLDQKACEFLPHVLAVQSGTRIAIRNSDLVLHSVRVFQEGKPAYLVNRWQKVDAADMVWQADRPGRYVVRCGVHLWMHAWIVVLPPAFSATSSPSGDFRLAGLPAGSHRLHFWHETAGEWEHPVILSAGGLDLGTLPFPARRKEKK